MSGLDESVDIVITPETKAVAVQNFGLMLVLGGNVNSTTRTVEVSSLTDALTYLAGGSSTPEYLKLQAAFAQNNAPDVIKLGHVRGTKKITDTGTWTAGGSISCKVNGVTCTANFTTDLATTMAALATDIGTQATAYCTAAYNSHVLTITPKTGVLLAVTNIVITGQTGTISVSLSATATEDFDDALTAIQLVDDDWYMLTAATVDVTTLQAVAAWVASSASPKIMAYASSDAAIVDSDATTDIVSLMKATPTKRVFGLYSGTAGTSVAQSAPYTATQTQAADAAVLGYISAYQPGTYNVAYTKLALITPDALTISQAHRVRGYYSGGVFTAGKEGNTFETLSGFNIVRWGRASDGSWIDLTIFQDWLVANLQAAVFGVLVNNLKVPFDYNGYAMIEGAMTAIFNQAQQAGAITPFLKDENDVQIGGYKITFPTLSSVPANDKANRLLQGIAWQCWYTNGINSVKMQGTITQ